MADVNQIRAQIEQEKAVLGIEFGSTRIKAVLIGEDNSPIAEGGHNWENHFENGVWTYPLEEVWDGLQDAYRDLVSDIENKYGVIPTGYGAIGISAMMHGYIPFNENNELLSPFRTWRNTMTLEAADILTELFQYNIPQRWTVAHLYQSILNGDDYIADIRYLPTLAGYVHWQLTGEKVESVGDASGQFPIDIETADYNQRMVRQFNELIADKHYPWTLTDILPKSLRAGEYAGKLTEEGARKLDPSGHLHGGIPMCPPEGDGGTGMVATNAVARRTGNVSAGTSVFGMVVLEKELSRYYRELDMVTTPAGDLVAMAHCNNCTSDLNSWMGMFKELMESMGAPVDMGALFTTLFTKAMEGDADGGHLLSFNYLSGEHVTGMEEGRPLFVRSAESRFNLANFMRTLIMASLSSVTFGMNLLTQNEGVKIDRMNGHGGIFKTKGVAQTLLSAALDCPVTVMKTAGEGGAWGVALQAAYLIRGNGKSLAEWLDTEVFSADDGETIMASEADVAGFAKYMETYKKGLPIQRAAVDHFEM